MQPYITKGQFAAVLVLGFVTAYYSWNEPLKQYAKENFGDNNVNKVSLLGRYKRRYAMTRTKSFFNTPTKISLCVGGFMGCILYFKTYLQDYITHYKRKNNEIYANIIYEKRKEREQQLK